MADGVGAARFYGELLGWSFDAARRIASLDGLEVAGIERTDGPARWVTAIAVPDADASAAAVADAGGTVADEPRDAGAEFYAAVLGWEYDGDPGGFGASIRAPGCGDHLAATVDPDIHVRQASAPPGFADVIGGMQPAGPGERPHWQVTFSVADRDGTVALAGRLGATVVSTSETPWTRLADLRDPAGAEFAVSQFTPPG